MHVLHIPTSARAAGSRPPARYGATAMGCRSNKAADKQNAANIEERCRETAARSLLILRRRLFHFYKYAAIIVSPATNILRREF